MNLQVDAVFENGVFRPVKAVSMPEGERVTLNVEPAMAVGDDLADLNDLLDHDIVQSYRHNNGPIPTLDEVRKALGSISGCMSDQISAERDER